MSGRYLLGSSAMVEDEKRCCLGTGSTWIYVCRLSTRLKPTKGKIVPLPRNSDGHGLSAGLTLLVSLVLWLVGVCRSSFAHLPRNCGNVRQHLL